MSFTYEVLEKWKKRGADNKSKNTYEMIVGLLKKHCSDIVDVNNESVFLQGSYANHTNIKDDSDIDVVVLAYNVFGNNAREVLPPVKIEEFNRIYSDSYYTLEEFKEVIKRSNSIKMKNFGNMYLLILSLLLNIENIVQTVLLIRINKSKGLKYMIVIRKSI